MAFWIIGGLILIFVLVHQFKAPSKNSESQQSPESMNPTPTKPPVQTKPAKSDANEKRHRIAGTSYHMNEIMKFAHENPDYKLTKKQIMSMKLENTVIYKYEFDPVTVALEPEPDNPHDKNAIKVLFNGVHIGYIKAGSCSHVNKLMKSNRIESISGRLYGGPSKMVCFYGDSPEDAEMEKSDGTVGAEIRIIEKPM